MCVRRKILVIDDDPVIRELLKSLLEKADYEVVLADNGLSGLEAAKRDSPDLVITDGLLPKLHGFRVCKAIKESDSPPKVIILTGLYTKPTYRREVTHQYLADDLLTKPFNTADLLTCIERLLEGFPRLNQPDARREFVLLEKVGDPNPSAAASPESLAGIRSSVRVA